MYNLWRFPTTSIYTSIDTYLNGSTDFVSMPEMITAIRKYSKDSIITLL